MRLFSTTRFTDEILESVTQLHNYSRFSYSSW